MSDLAPFVAAALRDKTVMELIEENKKLAKQHRQARTVEIMATGECDPIASALFDENGSFGGGKDCDKWNVNFSHRSVAVDCSLQDLPELEIRLGGISFAQNLWGGRGAFVRDDEDKDGRGGRSVHIEYSRNSYLGIHVFGGSEEFWDFVLGEHSDNVWEYIVEELPPETEVKIQYVYFPLDQVQATLHNFRPDLKNKRKKDVDFP